MSSESESGPTDDCELPSVSSSGEQEETPQELESEDEDNMDEVEEGETEQEEEEEEQAPDDQMEEVETSSSSSFSQEGPLYLVSKKVRIEQRMPQTIHEKNLTILCKTEYVPVDTLNYVRWLNDIRKSLFGIFADGNAIMAFDREIVSELNLKICRHMLTYRVGFKVNGTMRDNMSEVYVYATMSTLSYLNMVLTLNDNTHEIKNQYFLRRKMNVWSKKNALNVIMTPEREKEYNWAMANIFYYLSRKGKKDSPLYNMDLWYKETKEGALTASNDFFLMSEIFFYHGLREIYLSNGTYYLCKPQDVLFPPPEKILRFLAFASKIMGTKIQKTTMDGIICSQIPQWISVESNLDFHKKKSGDSDPPMSILLQQYGRARELSKWYAFINTHKGACDYWLTEMEQIIPYIYEENEEYMPVFEETSVVVFKLIFNKYIGVGLVSENLVVKQKDILLPFSSNSFYNSKYPKIVKTPLGFCLFDVMVKKLIPYKCFIVCLFAWLQLIKHDVYKKSDFVKTEIDVLLDNNLVKIKKFIRDQVEDE